MTFARRAGHERTGHPIGRQVSSLAIHAAEVERKIRMKRRVWCRDGG